MRLELGTEHEKTQCMHEESITVTAPGFVVKRGVSQGELRDFDFEIALNKWVFPLLHVSSLTQT